MKFVKVDLALDNLRSEPSFADLLKRLGFSQLVKDGRPLARAMKQR